ncbi:MAG TPA: hypothetical protein PL157_12120 [Acidobacteriota bacterium]|nr:hypothetical protein [Acidobacteriota bacterium]HNH83112.1 hypothetical protein [Acidobacteriota bacterium]
MPRFVFAKSLVVLVILVSGISTVTPLAGVNAQNKPEPASQPPADVKKLFDTINQLRVAPDQMPEAITKMVSEQDPGYETSDIFTKDVINGKTRLQNVEDLKTMVSEAEKLSALEWDADLVTLASQFKGEPQNKLFKLEVFRQGNGKPAERAMMWWAADRDFDAIRDLRNARLKYIGICKKPGENDDYLMCASALKGKAFLLKENELANRPYDPREDQNPPWNDALNVKQPNITSFVKSDGTLDVAWRDMGAPPRVFLTRFASNGTRTWTKEVPGVNPSEHQLLAGFTEDPEGNIYVLRAKDEGDHDTKNQPDPPKNDKGESDPTWDRPDMMKLTKLDKDGKELWTKDLAKKGGNAFGFISPMSPNRKAEEKGRIAGHDSHSSTSRIGFTTYKGTPIIFAFYGGATEWDKAISGRHQNAYWRTLNAKTGEPVENLNGSAMAHSFDSQLLVSDEGIITAERSDSGLLMANYLYTRSNPLIFHFFYATTTNGNECFTQLGSLTPADDGYLILIAGNNSESIIGKSVSGKASQAEALRNRNLMVIRIKKGFAQEIDALIDKPESKQVLDDILNSMKSSPERDGLNLIGRTYLTHYGGDEPYSASRPKMVRLADGNYVVLWERWTHTLNAEKTGIEGSFDSTWAMKINKDGEVLKEAVKLSDSVRITRGDEPVLWNGKASFLAGDVVDGKMLIHQVDGQLNYSVLTVPLN